MVIHICHCLLFRVVSIFFIVLFLKFFFLSLLLFTCYYARGIGFSLVMSAFLIFWIIEWCKLIDIFSLRCPFLFECSNCSKMAITFLASIFWDDCCWIFLGLFTLTWLWMLVFWLDLPSRVLGGDLVMVKVFSVQFEMVNT